MPTSTRLETHYAVTFARRGTTELKADIFLPPTPGPHPGVIMVHGGAWMSGSRWNMNRAARMIASAGYSVASVDYRLAPRHKFPAQLDDCKEAVRWMRHNAKRLKLDPQRLAGYGYSAGGHLVCLLGVTDADDGLEGEANEPLEFGIPGDEDPGAERSETVRPAADEPAGGAAREPLSTRLQAVVAGGAPCTFLTLPAQNQTMAYFLGGSRREKPEIYRQASPVTFATADDPPTLFFHGAVDRVVPRSSPRLLLDQLNKAGVRTEWVVVKDRGHITTFLANEPIHAAIKFFDEVLKPQPPVTQPASRQLTQPGS